MLKDHTGLLISAHPPQRSGFLFCQFCFVLVRPVALSRSPGVKAALSPKPAHFSEALLSSFSLGRNLVPYTLTHWETAMIFYFFLMDYPASDGRDKPGIEPGPALPQAPLLSSEGIFR